MKRQINFFQYIRGIGSVVVAIVHFEPHFSMALAGDRAALKFFSYFGYVFVDLFFMISGYVIWLTSYRLSKTTPLKNTTDFLIKRSVRIYLPYIPILLLTIAAFIMFVPTYTTDSTSVVKMFFLYPYDALKHVLPMSWTLSYELLFYLLYALLLLLVSTLKMRVILIFGYFALILSFNIYALFYVGTNHYGALMKLFPSIDSLTIFAYSYFVSPYMLEFCIGALLAAYCLNNKLLTNRPLIRSIKYTLFFTLIIAHIFFYKIGVELQTKEFERVGILAPILTLLMFVLLSEETLRTDQPSNNILLELGSASYFLYLIHFPVIYALLHFNLSDTQNIFNFILMSIIFVLMVIFSVLGSKYIEVPLYVWIVKKIT